MHLGRFSKEFRCPILDVLLPSHPNIIESLVNQVQSETVNALNKRDKSKVLWFDRDYYCESIHVLSILIGAHLYIKRF